MASLYYTEIGQILKNAREELYLTLPQASVALHIRAHYLHALEVGELDDLPGAAYTKGYLQSYAAFLRLDKDEILRRFERVENDLPEKGFFFPQVFSKEKKPSYPVVWAGMLFVLAAYLAWVFMFRPELTSFSVISQPPPLETAGQPGAVHSILNLACATPQVRLYPPCYSAENGVAVDNALLPMRRRINSVMELAE